MSDLQPFAFVLMPFDEKSRDVYELGIKRVCNQAGIVAERVDEQKFSETILSRIYRQIDTCDFIIAEMTGRNPNVFYEVGYAHARGKLCALLTQNAADIPFDLKQHRHIIYDGTIRDLEGKLRDELEWMKGESDKRKSRALSIGFRAEPFLERSDYKDIGQMICKLKIKNEQNKRSSEIYSISLKTSRNWSISQNGEEVGNEDDDASDFPRTHILHPRSKFLSAGAFEQINFEMTRQFWNRFLGGERENAYSAQGTIILTVSTAEGDHEFEIPLNLTFEEFPF